jgi:hypothetical protein
MAEEEKEEKKLEKPKVVSVDSKLVEPKKEVYKTLTPTQQAKVNLESTRGKILSSVRQEARNPRHIERYSEAVGSAALGVAREVMGVHANERGERVEGRTGVAAYALGERGSPFKSGGVSRSKRSKSGTGFYGGRARYTRQQFIGGSSRSRVINSRGNRVGPQSENEYNDNLPQNWGSVEDWRATSNAHLLGEWNGEGGLRSPIAVSSNKSMLPRFWDKPIGVQQKRKGMFVKGVFG